MKKTTAATTRVYGDALSSQSGFLRLRRAHRSTERGEVIPLDRTRTLHRRRKLGRQRPERANVLRPPLHPGKFVRAANKKLPGLNNQAGVEFVRRRPRASAIPGPRASPGTFRRHRSREAALDPEAAVEVLSPWMRCTPPMPEGRGGAAACDAGACATADDVTSCLQRLAERQNFLVRRALVSIAP